MTLKNSIMIHGTGKIMITLTCLQVVLSMKVTWIHPTLACLNCSPEQMIVLNCTLEMIALMRLVCYGTSSYLSYPLNSIDLEFISNQNYICPFKIHVDFLPNIEMFMQVISFPLSLCSTNNLFDIVTLK